MLYFGYLKFVYKYIGNILDRLSGQEIRNYLSKSTGNSEIKIEVKQE